MRVPIILDHAEIPQPDQRPGLPGLDAATPVRTVRTGLRRADELLPGMEVLRPDGRVATILGVIALSVPETVIIEAGALGPAGPEQTLTLAPDQYISLEHPVLTPLVGAPSALMRAGDLTHLPGVHVRQVPVPVFLPVFRHFTLICAGGIGLEGLPLTDPIRALLPRNAQAELRAALPQVPVAALAGGYHRGVPVLEARETWIATRNLGADLPVTALGSARAG